MNFIVRFFNICSYLILLSFFYIDINSNYKQRLGGLCYFNFLPELVYDDVFSVWETIWAAKHMTSSHFVLFIALALVQVYRDIILDNNMDFTDIIKFFNGMC